MAKTLETVQIANKKGDDYLVINKRDFDPETHTLYRASPAETGGDGDPQVSAPADEPTIRDIDGIGKGTAAKLAAMGIETLEQLADGDAEAIAEAVKQPVEKTRNWVRDARVITG